MPSLPAPSAISGHIRGFDGLRAISITMVVASHHGLFQLLPHTSFIRDRIIPLFAGVTGVNIFFTLSGFLITRLLLQEQDRKGTIQLRRFYIRRFLRLTPPFLLFFLLLGICVYLGWLRARPVGMLIFILLPL
ncbi:MAG: acyltransferase family protein [Flavobacteriales bacterium]